MAILIIIHTHAHMHTHTCIHTCTHAHMHMHTLTGAVMNLIECVFKGQLAVELSRNHLDDLGRLEGFKNQKKIKNKKRKKERTKRENKAI